MKVTKNLQSEQFINSSKNLNQIEGILGQVSESNIISELQENGLDFENCINEYLGQTLVNMKKDRFWYIEQTVKELNKETCLKIFKQIYQCLISLNIGRCDYKQMLFH